MLEPLLGQQQQQQQQQQEQQQEQQQQQRLQQQQLVADCTVVPVPPNMIPYRGLGLSVLERGGEKLQKYLFQQLKKKLQQKQQTELPTFEEYPEESRAYLQRVAAEERKQLQPGEVLLTPSFGATQNSSLLAFLAMPYYWQSSSGEAARRLSHCFRVCLKQLNQLNVKTLIVPFVGLGVYGFEPKRAAHTLIQAAIEEMLQADAVNPHYSLSRVDFVEKEILNSFKLAEALKDLEALFSFEKQGQPLYY
ncbi:hypothetical protein, conserved [Eimeria tenella]|uniref:Macro domain-containing protein n=1 Tax=Eimeria tenella TaxID=5802 RepID=U6L0D3_EIMTE|nr:hypothetical protein, conserved [Eimeria tenella]CDJ43656.1 hypothetical protein, conserved [Eimeria tenella]|eukprot:XP_013234405.1 hypothetical protein, conserved [Eimeria tenella]